MVTDEYSEAPMSLFAGQGINFRFRDGVKYNFFLRQNESSKNPQNTVLLFLTEPVKYYDLVLINSLLPNLVRGFLVQKHHFHLVFDGLP